MATQKPSDYGMTPEERKAFYDRLLEEFKTNPPNEIHAVEASTSDEKLIALYNKLLEQPVSETLHATAANPDQKPSDYGMTSEERAAFYASLIEEFATSPHKEAVNLNPSTTPEQLQNLAKSPQTRLPKPNSGKTNTKAV